MDQRVKRGPISALILSVIAPGAGLTYMHKPLLGFFCALIVLLALAGDAFFHTFSSIRGLGLSLGLAGAVWLLSASAALYAATKGLSREQAARDLGPWIVSLILLNMITLGLVLSLPYRSYTFADPGVSGLEAGEFFLGHAGAYDEARRSVGRERLEPGDVIVIGHASGETLSRVWGMAGDVLELRDGALFRNGQEAFAQTGLHLPGQSEQWVVPPDTVFLWNDQPGQGEEGDVPGQGVHYASVIRAKALYVYWSEDKTRMGGPVE